MNDQISFSSNRNTIQKFKLVLVGDQNVGKSSIIARYIRNEFDPTKNPTIGIDFISKNIAVAGKMIRLQLWDTAGQERFKSLIPSYLKDSHMALVVFDLTNLSSAENLNKWIDFIRQVGHNDVKIYVVGNKSDLQSENSLQTRKLAEQIAQKQANSYQQVSAKSNNNIENLFNTIIDDLLVGSVKKNKQINNIKSDSLIQSKEIKLEDKKNNSKKKQQLQKQCCSK